MVQEILACLDGSLLAEKILPLARGVAAATGAGLTVLNVVGDTNELAGAESYMRERAQLFGGQVRFLIAADPASAIITELEKNAQFIAAMTTHGRTAWSEAVLGSVALRVIRGSQRPVILYCPLSKEDDAPKKITTIAAALDGSEFAERILPFAAGMAKSLKARLLLIQALPLHLDIPEGSGRQPNSDIAESAYLHRKADEIRKTYGLDADWEVLHGAAADAICRHVHGMPETMLAITSHARAGLERAILGSVAGACVRRAGVPVLIYWSGPRS
jgi:nucleotide-binding universal stress UspA family protein